ncbi:MAG: YwiC-like family protein [Propioniciclava sp.]
MRPSAPRHRAPRWVPNQHGAWAMLLIPFLVGVIARAEAARPALFLVPLFVCWIVGYFAFYAASGWLKSAPARREVWVRPFLVEAAVTLVSGAAALLLTGPALAWWIPAFAVLLTSALGLARRRRERNWTGGALTVAAASLMILVARYPDPTEMLTAPDLTRVLVHTVATFAYFFGTVLHVKTNIRERGNPRFLVASVSWHAGASASFAALAALGVSGWWWPIFFGITTVRAAVIPRRTPVPRPRTIGLIEAGFSAALALGAILS